MNTLATSQINNVNPTSNTNSNKINNTKQTSNTNSNEIAYVKTPEWLAKLKCSINPKNSKKGNNNSFEYAIALSMTTGDNRNRPENIIHSFQHFNFDNTNHPPKEEDYKTFERNNQSIKLTVLKIGDEEKQLHFPHNDENNNGRNRKVVIILLENNHYIYVTKTKLLTKYIKSN